MRQPGATWLCYCCVLMWRWPFFSSSFSVPTLFVLHDLHAPTWTLKWDSSFMHQPGRWNEISAFDILDIIPNPTPLGSRFSKIKLPYNTSHFDSSIWQWICKTDTNGHISHCQLSKIKSTLHNSQVKLTYLWRWRNGCMHAIPVALLFLNHKFQLIQVKNQHRTFRKASVNQR